MLPRKHRIPREFLTHRPQMKSYSGDFLLVRHCVIHSLPSRVAVIISKKNAHTAVLRHEIKRKIIENITPFVLQHPSGHQIICSLLVSQQQHPYSLIKNIEHEIRVLLKQLL